MKDAIIVGGGLAGLALAENLGRRGKSFVLFDDKSQSASRVAGGLYNPVILKRLSAAWGAVEGMNRINFYHEVEARIGEKVVFPLPVLRRLTSVEEQNNWFAALDKPVLSRFMSPTLQKEVYTGIQSPFGYGEVLESGYVDTARLLKGYFNLLNRDGVLRGESFVYQELEVDEAGISYHGVAARDIFFADGFGLHQNPYFSWLPLDGTKGELLIVRAPNLKVENAIVKANVFVLPIGNSLFKIGATYTPWDKTPEPTEKGRQQLAEEAQALLSCDFEIVSQLAGIRPTVKDRRPLTGTHPEYRNVHVINGLGSRGIMLAPWMAECLLAHVYDKAPLQPDCNITRFSRYYSSASLS